MFGVVGNISPQQIKFPPVCPPKMFATPLDCLLIPVEDAITMIQKIVFDFQTVIPNAQLIINLLRLVFAKRAI